MEEDLSGWLNAEEFGGGPPEDATGAQEFGGSDEEFVQQAPEPSLARTVDEFAEKLSRAERQLRKAELYRDVIAGGLFDTAGDPIAIEVEKEFQAFSRERLGVLLGIDPPAPKFVSQFTEEQVEALRALADQINSKASLARTAGVAPVAKQQPRPRPRLRARAAAPAAPPRQAQAQTQAPPAVVATTPPPGGPPRPKAGPPAHGSTVTQGGRTFKVTWVEVDSPKDVGKGNRGVKTPDGRVYRILLRDVTPQVRTGLGLPMPTPQQMSAITALRASESLNNVTKETAEIFGRLDQ